MNKEILMVAEAVSAEKGVSEDIIFEAIELALATATKKRYDEEADILVVIDRESGDYVTTRRWLVVPDSELALLGTQFTTEEAAEVNTALQPGDYHEETVENVDFGRRASVDEINAAIKIAEADFVHALPNGLETTVAEGDPLPSATAPQPSVQPATSDAPPRAGRGSSRQAWADFAAAHIEVTDDLSRDDIIAALEQAGTIQKG